MFLRVYAESRFRSSVLRKCSKFIIYFFVKKLIVPGILVCSEMNNNAVIIFGKFKSYFIIVDTISKLIL